MTDEAPETWLRATFAEAASRRLCAQGVCTTCGSIPFRGLLWSAAARRARVYAPAWLETRPPLRYREALAPGDRAAARAALISGLRELDAEDCRWQYFYIVLQEVERSRPDGEALDAIDVALAGSPAGRARDWRDVREAAWRVEAEAREAARAAYRSPEAVAARKQAKRDAMAPALARRQAAWAARQADRLERLTALGALEPAERLRAMATWPGLIPEQIPAELIPVGAAADAPLSADEAAALLHRIGGRRRSWGELRRRLQRRFGPPPA
jgi:hypothetical protein